MSQKIKKWLVILGVQIIAVAVVGTYVVLSPDIESGESEFASESAVRSTELGVAKPGEKRTGEVDIKLLDPAMKKKWGLKMTKASEAWAKHKITGSRDIVVAVIDTGIDPNHPDLKKNLWINKGETGLDAAGKDKRTNGIDDDENGFVDDVHGWNFVHNNHDLKDNHGHGTHIAGIVGAEGGNGIGISGVAPKVSLMVLKYYDPKAPGLNNLMNTVKAIRYATAMNAKIINYSGGGLEKSKLEKQSIDEARRKGILFVAAAGNERSNSDIKGYYPADYELDNIISVTAVNPNRNVLPTSNYGKISVDVAAPGSDIYSTLPGNNYGPMTGTSQATAFVTGVAALIFAKFEDFDAKRVIAHIKHTGDLDEKLVGKTRYQKRLNTYRALAIQDRGVGVSGVVADNSQNFDSGDFAADPNTNGNADQMGSFSKALNEILVETNRGATIKKPSSL